MEQGSRTRLATALVIAVVFGAGVLLGLAADSSLGAAPTAPIVASSEVAEESAPRTPTYAEVGPTKAQQTLIDSIILVHRGRVNELDKQVRAEYSDGFALILNETREAIKGVFTPEQAAAYQRLLDERDAQRAAERASERETRDRRN